MKLFELDNENETSWGEVLDAMGASGSKTAVAPILPASQLSAE